MTETPRGMAAKLERVGNDAFNRPALMRVGRAGAQDATGVIKRKIGDTSMSHWWRRKPIDLTVKSWVPNDHEIVFGPERGAVGPSSVLNSGHKPYTKGDRRLTGKFTKTGKASTRRVKRGTAGSRGKGTATEGNRLIAERSPARLHDEFVKVLRREFRG